MNTDSQGPNLLRRLVRRYLPGRFAKIFTKYTIGSALAFVASEAVLLTLLGTGLTGPKTAAIGAWVAGSLVNYTSARNWAWRVHGRSNPWREILPFWATSLVGLVMSTWASALAHAHAPEITSSHALQLTFVGAVYLGTYGVLFVGKFLLFHYVIFGRTATGTTSR